MSTGPDIVGPCKAFSTMLERNSRAANDTLSVGLSRLSPRVVGKIFQAVTNKSWVLLPIATNRPKWVIKYAKTAL